MSSRSFTIPKMTNKRMKRSRVQQVARSSIRSRSSEETSIVKDEFDFEANEQELLSQTDSFIQKDSVKDTSSSNTLIISDDFEFKDEVNLTSYGKKRRVIVVSAEKDTKKKRVHVHRNQRRNLSKGECVESAFISFQ